jgi:hypothetical protein
LYDLISCYPRVCTFVPIMSFELKEKGNQLFKEGDYAGAEEMYSQA